MRRLKGLMATRTGCLSHFLLPTRGAVSKGLELDGRYGDEALLQMIHELKLLSVSPSQCQAKIFGGGNLFPGHRREGTAHVGQRNGDVWANRIRLTRSSIKVNP